MYTCYICLLTKCRSNFKIVSATPVMIRNKKKNILYGYIFLYVYIITMSNIISLPFSLHAWDTACNCNWVWISFLLLYIKGFESFIGDYLIVDFIRQWSVHLLRPFTYHSLGVFVQKNRKLHKDSKILFYFLNVRIWSIFGLFY